MKRAKATDASKCVSLIQMVASDHGVPDDLGCVLQRYNGSKAAVTIVPGGFVSWSSKLCTADWLAWEQQPQPPSASSCDVPRIDQVDSISSKPFDTHLSEAGTHSSSQLSSKLLGFGTGRTNKLGNVSDTDEAKFPDKPGRERTLTCRDRRGRRTTQDVGTLQKLRE